DQTRLTPLGSPPDGRSDSIRREIAPCQEPRDDRVRVPHIAGSKFVPAPDERGHRLDEIEDAMRSFPVVGEALWARDGLRDVGDHTVLPSTHLVTAHAVPRDPTAEDRPLQH